MIAYEEAIGEVLRWAKPLGDELVALEDAVGRVLSRDVEAPRAVPHFDSSAVDGFAVGAGALGTSQNVRLRVSATVRAGDTRIPRLAENHAIRIFTGAALPSGTRAVVMQERCTLRDGIVRIAGLTPEGENIRRAGAEFRKGDRVFPSGTAVTPPVAGMLAVLGRATVRVHRLPAVTLLVTGDELRRPGERVRPGEVYDANSVALRAALSRWIVGRVRVLAVKDSAAAVRAGFSRALSDSDVVISVGGVSVGEFDFVRQAAVAQGVRIRFWKVAMKPGKPVMFGTRGRTVVFGLPGNPVAAMLGAALFVLPALRRLSGSATSPTTMRTAVLAEPVHKKPGRAEFVRARLAIDRTGRATVVPTKRQESHQLSGLAAADCLVYVPLESSGLEAGASVSILPLPWSEA